MKIGNIVIPSKLFNHLNHKSIVEMITDSLFIGLFAAFSTLGNNIPDITGMYIAAKAFGIAFVLQYIYEKGIKQYSITKKEKPADPLPVQ